MLYCGQDGWGWEGVVQSGERGSVYWSPLPARKDGGLWLSIFSFSPFRWREDLTNIPHHISVSPSRIEPHHSEQYLLAALPFPLLQIAIYPQTPAEISVKGIYYESALSCTFFFFIYEVVLSLATSRAVWF